MFERVISWVSRALSNLPDASYGRLLSILSYFTLLGLNILIAINPKHIITNFQFLDKFQFYLFVLILAGYSITSFKDILTMITVKLTNKSNKLEDESNDTADSK